MTDGLLLVHAFPVDARMWEGQVEGFGRDLPVVAPDLPGFGGTAPAPGGVMTMRSGAERCLEALERAGVDRAVVCGLSLGGYVALELWRTARERIAGLVLANTRAEADAPEGVSARRALAERLATEGNVLVDAPPPLLSEGADDELRGLVRGWIADQDPAAIAAGALGMAERPDSTADLPTIDVPTLVITSERDALIPPDVTAAMADRVPEARLLVIAGAGHLSNLEAPGAFDDALREHLHRCGLAR